MTARKIWLCLYFFLFALPISAFDGKSANYLFLLFPLIRYLTGGRLIKPKAPLPHLMALFTFIFLAAAVYQYAYYGDWLQRAVSFLIFMGMFSFALVEVDTEMVDAFKVGIVLISLALCLNSLYDYWVLGGGAAGFDLKGLMGSQRFGFIYLIALWLALLQPTTRLSAALAKYLVIFIILIGMLLTFSRSTVVALMVSVGAYFAMNLLVFLRRPRIRLLVRGAAAAATLGLAVLLVYWFAPVTFDFFRERLSYQETVGGLGNPEGSEGSRVVIFQSVLDFVMRNPLTGSGYLGIWILDPNRVGSAHSQYNDVLFRTGIIGFLAYAYLLYLLLRFLFIRERALFWGVTGMLVYGFFHETFKESQGGFVLAFLLGMMSQSRRPGAEST